MKSHPKAWSVENAISGLEFIKIKPGKSCYCDLIWQYRKKIRLLEAPFRSFDTFRLPVLHCPHIVLHPRQRHSTTQSFGHECPQLREMDNRTDGVRGTVKLSLEIPSLKHQRLRLS